MMRWVQSARLYPARCSVLPQVGGNHPRGYIDSGVDTTSGERVYVSVLAAEAMAEAMGFRRPGDTARDAGQVGELEAANRDLEAKVRVLEGQLSAVHTLRQAGFTAARKPGRPKEKVTSDA